MAGGLAKFFKKSKGAETASKTRVRGAALPGFADDVLSTKNFDSLSNSNSIAGLASRVGYKNSDASTTSIPPLKQAKKHKKENRPSVTTLNRQLKSLASIALRIGVVTKEQQETLLAQVKEQNRAARESQTEGHQVVSGTNATGGNAAMDVLAIALLKSISGLTNAIEEKIQDSDSAGTRFMDGFYGAAGVGQQRAAAKAAKKVPKLKRGFKFDEKAKRYYKEGPNGKRSFVKEEDALRNAKKADLRTNAARARRAEQHAQKVEGAASKTARGARSADGVAGVVGRAAKKAGGGRVAATGELIAKIARPLVKNAVVKTAVKSIPIIGAVAGVGFAVDRLMHGDVVGAGLDAVSGLAGPMTAIPALAASISRDVYSSTFGVQPEADPMVKERMAMVAAVVNKLIKEWLKDKVIDAEPVKNAPVSSRRPASVRGGPGNIAAPAVAAAAASGTPSAPKTAPQKPPSSPQPVSKPKPTQHTPPRAHRESARKPSAPSIIPVSEPSTPTSPAEPVQSVDRDGGIVAAASENLEARTESGAPAPMPQKPSRMVPSSTQTTRTGATGMGNVPDPTYSAIDVSMFDQMYFGAAA